MAMDTKEATNTTLEDTEARASLDKAKVDTVPGVNEEQKALFLQFASKDE